MPACCSSWILLLILPCMGQASSCNDTDRSLLMRHKRFNKKQSMFVIPGMPDSCSTFMTDESAAGMDATAVGVSKKMFDATAVTATRMMIGLAGGAMAAAGAAASFGGGFLFPLFAGVIFPDPQTERIEKLEKGLDCAFQALQILHGEIQRLDEELEKTRQLSVLGQSQGLKDMASKLKTLAKNHQDCAKLMKCVADVKILDDDRFSATSCEQLLLHEAFGIYSTVEDCNADAFRRKFVQNDQYNFVDSDMTHVEEVIKLIISENWEDQYKTAHSLVLEYADVATAFSSAWSAMEEWAGAICQPWSTEAVTTKSSCTADDELDIKRGLGQFKDSYHGPFLKKLAAFNASMSTADFLTQRKMSVVSYNFPETTFCQVRWSKTEKQEFGGSGLSHTWTALRSQEKFDLFCDYDKLHEKVKNESCMNMTCIYAEHLPMPPFGCQEKDCDFDGCKLYKQNVCPPCGYVNCDDYWPLKMRYDHLGVSMKVFADAYVMVNSREMTKPPPYRLAPDTTYFLEYDLRPGGHVPPPPTTTS